jgi:tRNA G37 N-methylase Trm5
MSGEDMRKLFLSKCWPKKNDKELYDATKLLCNQVYIHIHRMGKDDLYMDGIHLWCFVKEFRAYNTYPLSNLLEIDFVKKWWDQ